jgi:hypothetical protein
MRVRGRLAVDEHGRPCELPADETHTRSENGPDAQEHQPEQRKERDRNDHDDSV